jgi:hypothetical protein
MDDDLLELVSVVSANPRATSHTTADRKNPFSCTHVTQDATDRLPLRYGSAYIYALCRNAVVIDNNGEMHADMQNQNFILGAQHLENKLYFEFAPLVSPRLALLA